jgi:hypothetical protein
MISWDTRIGEITTREALAGKYGGSANSGGIVPSRSSPNVFVFSDPPEGRKWGYTHDGHAKNGSEYFYTGQGTVGDQQLKAGNKSLANHIADGRTVRLFVAAGRVPGSRMKYQKYVGEYSVHDGTPYRQVEAKDANGALRLVLVFRLVPMGDVLPVDANDVALTGTDPDEHQAQLVPREIDSRLFYETKGSEPSSAIKAESQLVGAYEAWRGRSADPFKRWTIRIPGERAPLLTDIYDANCLTLFEAKATSSRDSVRQALGQLLDYRRHIPVIGLHSALLLPSRPSEDLEGLISSSGMGLVYRDDAFGFEASKTFERHLKSRKMDDA